MKKFAIVALVLIFALAMFAGCHKHTYTVGKGAPEGKMVYENQWTEHWFFGIIGDTAVNIKEVCPSGNATIHDEISFLNGLIGALVGIIYYPSTVTVKCDGGNASVIEIDYDTAARIVADPRFLEYVEATAPELLDQALLAQVNAVEYLYN